MRWVEGSLRTPPLLLHLIPAPRSLFQVRQQGQQQAGSQAGSVESRSEREAQSRRTCHCVPWSWSVVPGSALTNHSPGSYGLLRMPGPGSILHCCTVVKRGGAGEQAATRAATAVAAGGMGSAERGSPVAAAGRYTLIPAAPGDDFST